jgi:hypothetical protein
MLRHGERGIDAQLVAVAEWPRQHRPAGLKLWTFGANARARRFYERHRFVATGPQPATPRRASQTSAGSGRHHGWPRRRTTGSADTRRCRSGTSRRGVVASFGGDAMARPRPAHRGRGAAPAMPSYWDATTSTGARVTSCRGGAESSGGLSLSNSPRVGPASAGAHSDPVRRSTMRPRDSPPCSRRPAAIRVRPAQAATRPGRALSACPVAACCKRRRRSATSCSSHHGCMRPRYSAPVDESTNIAI